MRKIPTFSKTGSHAPDKGPQSQSNFEKAQIIAFLRGIDYVDMRKGHHNLFPMWHMDLRVHSGRTRRETETAKQLVKEHFENTCKHDNGGLFLRTSLRRTFAGNY